MPVASANAHNLWWLVTAGAPSFVVDHERWLGSLTYRQAALLLLLPVLGFTLWRAWFARGPWELSALAAYTAHAWFCLTTGAHENHPFMIFPFLCLVWWRTRFLSVVLVLLTATFSFNVLVHDPSLQPFVGAVLDDWSWRLQMAASALNLAILAAWTVWLLRPDRHALTGEESPSYTGIRARGSGSVVEHHLAKVRVAGSNPVFRSRSPDSFTESGLFAAGLQRG
jgi:hypothetical protein